MGLLARKYGWTGFCRSRQSRPVYGGRGRSWKHLRKVTTVNSRPMPYLQGLERKGCEKSGSARVSSHAHCIRRRRLYRKDHLQQCCRWGISSRENMTIKRQITRCINAPLMFSDTRPIESIDRPTHATTLPLPSKDTVLQLTKAKFTVPLTVTEKEAPRSARMLVLVASSGGLADAPKVVIADGRPSSPISMTFPCIEMEMGRVEAFATRGV